MYSITIPKRINQAISVFYFIGVWSESRFYFRKWFSKLMHLVALILFTILVILGILTNNNNNVTESVLSVVLCIDCFVQIARLYYLVSKQDTILGLVRALGDYSIKDRQEANRVSKKINRFMKFAVNYNFAVLCGVFAFIIVAMPIISNGRTLPFNAYTPCRGSDIVYWIMFVAAVSDCLLLFVYNTFGTITWYLMMSCAIKYEILGNEFRNLGKTTLTKKLISLSREKDWFLAELVGLIKNHQALQKTTAEFKSCYSNLFFIQIATSGMCICGSMYSLAFISLENSFIYVVMIGSLALLMHNVFDIFMVTYFGNEIKFSSSFLSYCLFESNWAVQSKSGKKSLCIFMEVLKRPEVLLIGKLYPLDLQIFTKILNFAYSMFNILKNVK